MQVLVQVQMLVQEQASRADSFHDRRRSIIALTPSPPPRTPLTLPPRGPPATPKGFLDVNFRTLVTLLTSEYDFKRGEADFGPIWTPQRANLEAFLVHSFANKSFHAKKKRSAPNL